MYSSFRHASSIFRKSHPIHLTFFVTRKCNAHCPFCFYLKGANNVPADNELSSDEIRKISASMGNLLWLAFSGGEIFLRDDLVDISEIFYHNNRPPVILYPTNGLLPEVIRDRTEMILQRCRESVIAVKLSIDGLHEEHDVLRNTPGSFEKTMSTYELLGDLIEEYDNFELGINTVFCADNQNSMNKIIDFIITLEHVKTHTISLVRGNLRDEKFKDVDMGLYFDAVNRLEKNLKERNSRIYRFRGSRIKAAQDILQRQLINRTAHEKKRLIPCYAGRLNLVLTENGYVYPCEILTRSFGNVRDYDYDMEKVARSEEAQAIVRSISSNDCYCTHECYFMTNILFNPRLYPRLAREYISL